MTSMSGNCAMAVAVIACVTLPATAARAQWSGANPAYTYDAQPRGPYAVEVAPNTYVIHRPSAARKHYRRRVKREVVTTRKVVRDPPRVIEHRRVVDDPPRVINRYHIVEDAPAKQRNVGVETPRPRQSRQRPATVPSTRGHIIHADAEIVVLGPGRMDIHIRERGGGNDTPIE
jgi:hypothetical protein